MQLCTYLGLGLVYTCFHLTHICLSCVLLLNGWEPKSISERAGLAEIVGVADVVRTFKSEEERAEDGTYTAEVRLVSLYKGHNMMSRLDPDSTNALTTTATTAAAVTRSLSTGTNLFNITNFGSKTQCYADVSRGQRYILFLTEFERRLSAQYHDLFGAAEAFTDMAEEEILQFLGWRPWSEWSPCSKTCTGGYQSRSRECPRDNGTACIGVGKETRSCNLFNCLDSHDILSLLQLHQQPRGVTPHSRRASTYIINKTAKLSLPVSQIFPVTFPSQFSILFRLKISRRKQRGYFFVVNDLQGTQKIAVFLGRKLKFQYLGNSYGFRSDLLDNRWHSVALQVNESELVVSIDCDITMKRRLRARGDYLGTNLMMTIGPYYAKYGRAFVGEVEQLVLSSDPKLASQQCGHTVLRTMPTIEILTSSTPNSVANESSSTSSLPDEACLPLCQNNATCLPGNVCRCQARFSGSRCQTELCSIPCKNDGVCLNGSCLCTANFTGTMCEKASCTKVCLHGGKCVGNDTCLCQDGYTGSQCQNYTCSQQCYSRGICVGPNRCQCPTGYYGPQCEKARCRPRCKNGGTCVSPHRCLCKSGYTGKRCQKSLCLKGCKNGGKCGKSGKCICPPFFYGRRCQKARCRQTCLHGGRCKNQRCVCSPGFHGKQCEKSSCQHEHYLVPFRRTYRKLIREKLPIPCGHWTTEKKCTKTRLKYVRITKDTYRSAYRCV